MEKQDKEYEEGVSLHLDLDRSHLVELCLSDGKHKGAYTFLDKEDAHKIIKYLVGVYGNPITNGE